MSEPSIEGLRQAFLDWRSRIRLEGDPRIVRHDRIVSLSIEDVAFLGDQEVVFSPHLNCLIGGRGSGKSSLFEYLRFAVRREEVPASQEQVKRIRGTFLPSSRLRLRWAEQDDAQGRPGPEDTFEYQPSGRGAQVVSRDVADASTVFQGLEIQIFSQRQVTEVARRQDFLLSLMDTLVERRLRPLLQEEAELKERIQQLQGQQRTLERLRSEERALRQEVQELERRWAARAAVQEEQKRHRAAQDATRYLETLEAKAARVAEDLENQAGELGESHAPLGSVVRDWPEDSFFESLDAEVEKAFQRLATDLREAAARYRERIKELTSGSQRWERVQESLKKAEQDFRSACAQLGLRPEDLEQLFELDAKRKSKSLELDMKRSQAALVERSVRDLPDLWRRLLAVWRSQTRLRREEIDRILDSRAIPKVSRDSGRRPTLEAQLDFQGDRDGFLEAWSSLSPDARTRLGRQWEELGDRIFSEFQDLDTPWQVVDRWLENGAGFPLSADLLPLLREHLASRSEAWERIRLTRIRDSVDLILYRADGSRAGSLRRRELSDGQTNTAVLMLLLASGRGPILIDQPEDELDSNFISQQLVPLLREIKNERQVILVTHNPNLPVNGDAELVYALKAEAREGQAHGVLLAQGGLDRPEVKEAVLDIMEGSEDAFRRRREKYHF
jgi:DNA repair exonuclease SbcCD ATPase subunit